MPVATAAALPNSEWIHGICQEVLGVRRRKHFQAAGGVGRDQLAVGSLHRSIDRVARTERLAAALAGAVAGVQRVGAVRMLACTRALLRVCSSRLPTVKVPVW